VPGAGAVDTSGRSMGFVECQTSHFSTFAPMSKPPSKTVTGEEDGKKQEVFSPAILGVIICAGVFGLLLCILSAWIICCKGTGKEHVAALPGAYAKPISNSAPAFGDPRLEPPFRPAPSLLQPPSQPASARGDTRPPLFKGPEAAASSKAEQMTPRPSLLQPPSQPASARGDTRPPLFKGPEAAASSKAEQMTPPPSLLRLPTGGHTPALLNKGPQAAASSSAKRMPSLLPSPSSNRSSALLSPGAKARDEARVESLRPDLRSSFARAALVYGEGESGNWQEQRRPAFQPSGYDV